MYFQTGQMIFVPEWPKGEFVSIIGLILFGQNHLYVKNAVLQGIPIFIRVSEDYACKTENLRFPVSRSDDHAIPSGRPSVRMTCLTVRTPDRPSIIRPNNVHFPSGPLLYREATVPALHPSKRLNSTPGHLSVINQLQILSKFNLREDCVNRPDDVDSRPDALIHKARIAIQISPSGRQSPLVRTCVLQLRKLPIRLQPSGRLPIMVWMREALYGSYL
jgi:hypothetical protein